MTEPTLIPSHVPPHLVFDFDYVDDVRLKPDPHAAMRLLHEQAPPIFYTPRHGGHWICRSYRTAFDISRNPGLFSSKFTASIPKPEVEIKMFPISLDPPEHGIYRAALAPIFGPKAMNMLRADIRRLAVDLILPVIPRGRCDFLKEVAEPLPVTIFLTLMGMPLDRLHEFRNLAVRAVEAQSADVFAEVAAINAEIIRARQGSDGDDIVSRLWRSDINGRPPTFDEMGSICLLLFIGGLDTVVNGLGFAIRHLARDQELQARLRSDPGLIPEAVEEILRMYGIAQTQRVLTRNAEYEGVNFREGDVVLCLVSAANRDPEAFVDPDTAKLGRDGAHLTFNTGIHRCLGSHLARIELQTVYEEWLQRVPTFTLDREHSPLAHAGRIMGLRSVPVVWNTSS